MDYFPTNASILHEARTNEAENLLHAAEKRLDDLKCKIAVINKKVALKANNPSSAQDWTTIYEKCADWEELEELHEAKVREQHKIESLLSKQDNLGHYHDHTQEREFFQLPEDEKIKRCDDNRVVGNYLFSEGNYERAAERYQIAIGYYEYCFPSEAEVQTKLDEFRHSCLCNLALCQIRLGSYRSAIDSTTRIIQECSNSAKAYFRRGQAHRMLDEYE